MYFDALKLNFHVKSISLTAAKKRGKNKCSKKHITNCPNNLSYSDMYCINYIEFRDFYTDGKNVYLTCEKVATPNPSSEEKPSIYFVVIPKSLIEHEMSDEIVMHFLHQKS